MIVTLILILVAIVVGLMAIKIKNKMVDAGRPSKMFEKYQHHGESLVWVRSDLKGRHRKHCLCFDCKRFHPGSTGNCTIAQATYENCLRHNIVTPVWECPRFRQDPNIS